MEGYLNNELDLIKLLRELPREWDEFTIVAIATDDYYWFHWSGSDLRLSLQMSDEMADLMAKDGHFPHKIYVQ